jgi:4-hydroxy-3-methylbut-2-enyl diphosphate reductase IspH
MEVRTAQVGFCFGIERAYSAFDKHARAGERIHVAHRAGGAWDTLRRIERRDPALLDRYPGLRDVAVTHDVATLKEGDKLVLGFHGLADDTKTALTGRGVAMVEDMLCPFIAKLDRVVEQAAWNENRCRCGYSGRCAETPAPGRKMLSSWPGIPTW